LLNSSNNDKYFRQNNRQLKDIYIL